MQTECRTVARRLLLGFGRRNDAAGDASTATAERRWRVAVVVAAFVDHDGVAYHVLHFEAGHFEFALCVALGIDNELGQIAFVALTAGTLVRFGGGGVIVAS